MDLYKSLINDDEFLNYFCDVLEDNISEKTKYKVNISFKKSDMSIFFFIDGSSILQVMPDKDLQYTYAHVPSYEDEIQHLINIIEKQYKRDKTIEEIIKKES
jgi:hypothetical protein